MLFLQAMGLHFYKEKLQSEGRKKRKEEGWEEGWVGGRKEGRV